jgi:hypothetical protein
MPLPTTKKYKADKSSILQKIKEHTPATCPVVLLYRFLPNFVFTDGEKCLI